MTENTQAVLDACVLVNAPVRDTLLRLAERQLYRPLWSDLILYELTRTLQRKLGKTRQQTDRLLSEMQAHFGEAWVTDYQGLVGGMTNDAKDRHVLAAAVHANAQVIVTFNLWDFPDSALDSWLIEARHPDAFLLDLYRAHSGIVVHVLHEQA